VGLVAVAVALAAFIWFWVELFVAFLIAGMP